MLPPKFMVCNLANACIFHLLVSFSVMYMVEEEFDKLQPSAKPGTWPFFVKKVLLKHNNVH